MSRFYQELVEVRLGEPGVCGVRLERGWCRDAGPAQEVLEVPTAFLWRGRLLVVRAVLARWTQRVPWWRQEGGPVQAEGELLTGAGHGLQREVWRVEASAGRAFGSGVYELSLVPAPTMPPSTPPSTPPGWLLERVCD